MTDDNVTKLDAEVDDHKCRFGKWLYSEGGKEAEKLVPSIASLLKKIEESHRKLHESAAEIGNKFRQPHTGLALVLSNCLQDHIF